MRKWAAILLALFVLLPQGAVAAHYASTDYGFAADFVTAPEIMPPQPSEKDDKGGTLSTAVLFKSAKPSVYVTSVVVDTFDAPFTLNVPASLQNERDNFVAPLQGAITDSRTDMLQGSPAIFFTFETGDHAIKGRGMIVILDKATPRIYVATMVYTSAATQSQIADLNAFIDSFKLQ